MSKRGERQRAIKANSIAPVANSPIDNAERLCDEYKRERLLAHDDRTWPKMLFILFTISFVFNIIITYSHIQETEKLEKLQEKMGFREFQKAIKPKK